MGGECVRCVKVLKIPQNELIFQEKEKQVVRESKGGGGCYYSKIKGVGAGTFRVLVLKPCLEE